MQISKKCNVAIVGATGLVGRTMLKVLIERNFPINEIKLLASARSAGNTILFKNQNLTVEPLNENSFENVDIALFSAGAYVSENFAPIAVKSGCIVIDNGSFWRMKPEIPLVVPEVNAYELHNHKGLIANPNCSTIQLVVPLHFISKINPLKRVVISTYQATSGAGQKGLDKYHSEMQGIPNDDKYKIFNSVIFHSAFNENGNTIEEEKMINETRKILNIPLLPISATCVRIPIENSHSISANVELANSCDFDAIKNVMLNSKGIIFVDSDSKFDVAKTADSKNNADYDYPFPLMSNDKDEVFVGRLRKDHSAENAISLWVVADNLRKGAATNAVQIAEYILEKKL